VGGLDALLYQLTQSIRSIPSLVRSKPRLTTTEGGESLMIQLALVNCLEAPAHPGLPGISPFLTHPWAITARSQTKCAEFYPDDSVCGAITRIN
jgi:hypothetical protein